MENTVDQKDHLKIIAESLQADCHKTVEAVIKKVENISYQDATNVWIFQKLAEYEIRLQIAERNF